MKLFGDMPYSVREEIRENVILAAGASPAGTFIPLLDIGAITAIWAKMMYKIGRYHNVCLSESDCVAILGCCGKSITAFLVGSKIFSAFLHFIPGLGTLGAMATNVMLNAYYTYDVGKAYHQMLATEGISRRATKEIAHTMLKFFNPMPRPDTLKSIFHLVKGDLDEC